MHLSRMATARSPTISPSSAAASSEGSSAASGVGLGPPSVSLSLVTPRVEKPGFGTSLLQNSQFSGNRGLWSSRRRGRRRYKRPRSILGPAPRRPGVAKGRQGFVSDCRILQEARDFTSVLRPLCPGVSCTEMASADARPLVALASRRRWCGEYCDGSSKRCSLRWTWRFWRSLR